MGENFPEKMSYHESINAVHQRLKSEGMETVYERYLAQEKIRCTQFCVKGLSCQLCSQGPCRIVPGKVERGVCGIDRDGMVMRNLIHKLNFGIAAYTYHAIETAEMLRETADGKTPFSIKDPSKVDFLAKGLGVQDTLSLEKKAKEVARRMLEVIHQSSEEESEAVKVWAPKRRQEVWRKLGIFPGGPMHELLDTVTRTMTNIDGNYVALALAGLRMGTSMAFASQLPLEMAQDAIFGTPMPHEIEVDLGILDPEFVNIALNGHEPFVGMAVLEELARGDWQEKARQAGAKGIKLIAAIETGQEIVQRVDNPRLLAGLTGNWLSDEFVLATGAVDVFAMDMNCSPPSLALFAEKFGSKLVAVSKIVSFPGVSERLHYNARSDIAVARRLLELGIENFKHRRKQQQEQLPKRKALIGFSNEAVLKALGGSFEPLLDVIKNGKISGVVALVSCTTLKNGPQDALSVPVAKELIKRNFLVISGGCGNGALEVAGLTSMAAQELAGNSLKSVIKSLGIPPVLSFGTCTDCGRMLYLVGLVADSLGVDVPQLPVAVTAPEYMEQKATIDAFAAVAFGLYTHVSPVPPVTGSEKVVKLLTEEVEALTGGKMAIGDDPVTIVDGIETHIRQKRKSLGFKSAEKTNK